ncbi:beta-1,3-galactosyltransferase 5 [Cimex lectularius]|uniref:Hexosyltransferase n=1 Tax=Cimex lectularius TaxID=79782 RepID=A0A8I6THR6_CIMLE|nr:beta-1,3-galactosyltransferase 5 [Cimex lectularius]XP_014261650.1 beta-1,3-galactosyltransferase 5 [Cimex lectularius]XP_014261651.1 beta-1,3-galactosyltransferase 5 [Cimex lectularius]XP_014261652.1 beta-1,3-galactosyltransferase 5 [Cimex lectularius]XP_024081292.1 beta-1,3-galactosyltransferase 5 [Cimex lectularius]
MFDKRCCRLVWGLILLGVVGFMIWRLSGCPGPPRTAQLPVLNYLPLVPSNATTAPAPYQIQILPPDDLSTLINLKEFSFLSKYSCNATPLVAVIVHSAPNNIYHRRMIRSTWGNALDIVFMVGETNSSSIQNQLEEEMKEHSDIVQGTFIDSYRNMTYKHVMGLKWATYHCPGARYILKTDDDVFVNTPFLQAFLNSQVSPLGARRLLLCNVMDRTIVKRSYRSKWRVTPAEYSGRWYPKYCTGWAVLYSPDVAFTLYAEAQKSKYFWIDDVHITGTLVAKTNITHTTLGSLAILEEFTKNLVYSGQTKSDFLFSLTSPKYFKYLWDMVNHPLVPQQKR